MTQNSDKDTRKAYRTSELPNDLKRPFEKGYQGRETPELDHLLEESDGTANHQKRRAYAVGEMSEDEIRQLEEAEMPEELNYLNNELEND